MKKGSFFVGLLLVIGAFTAAASGFTWDRSSLAGSSTSPKAPLRGPRVSLKGHDWSKLLASPQKPSVGSNPGSVQPAELRFIPASERVPRPTNVRGIYVTGWIAGSSNYFASLIRLVDETELNAMVIDIKDDTGVVSYPSQVKEAVALGSISRRVAGISTVLATLREHHIYPIARIAVFKDNLLPRQRPELAIHNSRGEIWRDKSGIAWADPYSRQVWDYEISLAKEAVRLGFSEVQFDYVRFPDVPKGSSLVYPAADGRDKTEVIRDFLVYARQQLHPMGVKVSADIFGLVTTAQDDLGIGQHLEDMASAVDYLHPMVYPSHYYHGEFGISNPDAVPYTTVLHSLQDAVSRLSKVSTPAARIVPWLQDFSLRHPYGPAEVRAQIKAAQEVGIQEWFLWNPRNRYTREALQ